MTTLEEAKAFLKKEAADGTNLYDHLADVLLKILVERPENLHDSFENLSVAVKQQRYVPTPQRPAIDSVPASSAKKEFVRACWVLPAHSVDASEPLTIVVVQLAQQERWCQAGLELLKVSEHRWICRQLSG